MVRLRGDRLAATVWALLLTSAAPPPPLAAQGAQSSQPPAPPPPALAPAIEPESATPPLPVDVDKVRRALARPSTLMPAATTLEVDGTTYRVNVSQKSVNIWDFIRQPETHVSPNVRTWYFSNWHAEYLRMVTPDYGRRAALYPTATLPGPFLNLLTQAIEDALDRRAKRKAKEEVQEALEDFFREHPEARVKAPSAPATANTQPPS